MFKKNNKNSIIATTPSQNAGNYDFFNKLYENTFNIKDKDNEDDFDLNAKLDSLKVDVKEENEIFNSMYKEADIETGISKNKYAGLPENNAINNGLKAYKEQKKNLLTPSSSNVKTENTTVSKEEAIAEKKGLHKSIPILSDAIGGGISAVGGAAKTFGEWDYKLDVKKAERYLKKAENSNSEEEKEKYLKKYNEEMAKAEYWRQNTSDTADKIMNYGDSYSTIKEDAGMIEKATKGAVSSLANMGVGALVGGGQPLVGMGVTTYGQGLKEGQDLNLAEDDAKKFAISNAIIETGSELLLPGAKGLKSFFTTGSIKQAIKEAGVEGVEGFVKEIAKEFGTEGLTEVANIVNEFRFKDKDGNSIAVNGGDFSSVEAGLKTILEAGERTITAGLSGAIMGGITQGGANMVNKNNTTTATADENKTMAQKQFEEQQASNPLKGFLDPNIKSSNETAENTVSEASSTSSKAINDINSALGFDGLTEADINEIQPSNPNAPFVERTVDANGTDVFVNEDGSTVNAKLVEMYAENNGIDVSGLTQYTPEEANARAINQSADNTISAIEEAIKTQGVEGTIETLTASLNNGEITQDVYNSAVEYVSAVGDETQFESTQDNISQHELTQDNASLTDEADFNPKTAENTAYGDKESTGVNTKQRELTQDNASQQVSTQDNIATTSSVSTDAIGLNGVTSEQLAKAYSKDPALAKRMAKDKAQSKLNEIQKEAQRQAKIQEKLDAKLNKSKAVKTVNKTVSKAVEKGFKSNEATKLSKKEQARYESESKKINEVVNTKAFKNNYPDLKLEAIAKKTTEQQSINELAKAISREVIFYKADSKNAPNGFMNDNILYLNGDYNANAMVQVLGHETFHTLKTENTAVFNELVKYGMDNFTTKEINAFLSKIDNEAEVQKLRSNPELLAEEMLAEAFGNDFANKEFWNGLEKTNKSLFEKIKDIIAKIFKKAEANTTDFLTKKHIKELRSEFESILGDLVENKKRNLLKTETFTNENGVTSTKYFQSKEVIKHENNIRELSSVFGEYNRANEKEQASKLNELKKASKKALGSLADVVDAKDTNITIEKTGNHSTEIKLTGTLPDGSELSLLTTNSSLGTDVSYFIDGKKIGTIPFFNFRETDIIADFKDAVLEETKASSNKKTLQSIESELRDSNFEVVYNKLNKTEKRALDNMAKFFLKGADMKTVIEEGYFRDDFSVITENVPVRKKVNDISILFTGEIPTVKKDFAIFNGYKNALSKSAKKYYDLIDEYVKEQLGESDTKFSTRRGNEFDEWFKGSIMVDKNGNPETFIHYTDAVFTEFKETKSTGLDQFGKGFYFGVDDGKLNQFGSNYKKVNLKVENPLKIGYGFENGNKIEHTINTNEAKNIINDYADANIDAISEDDIKFALNSLSKTAETSSMSFISELKRLALNNDFRDVLKDYGYDAIIYENKKSVDDNITEILVFDKEQVNITEHGFNETELKNSIKTAENTVSMIKEAYSDWAGRVNIDDMTNQDRVAYENALNTIEEANEKLNTISDINGDNVVKFSSRDKVENSSSFKNWFKDSKVVDGNGNPLIVYHGTPNGTFNTFKKQNNKNKNTDHITSYLGHFFTNNKEVADSFKNDGTNNKTYETYLSIQNPKIFEGLSENVKNNNLSKLKTKIDSLEKDINKTKFDLKLATSAYMNASSDTYTEKYNKYIELNEKLKSLKETEKELNGKLADFKRNDGFAYLISEIESKSTKPYELRYQDDRQSLAEKYVEELKEQGYDGIIIKNTKADADDRPINQYVAFYSNQIKSATDNNGNFDANNDDIRFSTRTNEEVDKITAPLHKVISKTNNLQLNIGIKKVTGVKVDNNIDLLSIFNEAVDMMAGNEEATKTNIKALKQSLKTQGIEDKQAKAIAKYFTHIIDVAKENFKEPAPDVKNTISSSHFKAKRGIKNAITDYGDSFYTHVVDNTHAGKMVNEVFTTKARISKNSFSIAENIFDTALTDSKGKKVNKSLQEMFKDTIPKGKELEFMTYALHKHNISRALQKKYVFFNKDGTPVSSTDSAKIVAKMEAQNPDFASRQEQFTGWINDFMKAWAVDTGLMSEDMHSMLKEMYNHYVPTNRSFQDHEELFGGGYGGKGFVDKSKPTKRAQKGGSSRDIVDLQESVVQLVTKTVRTAKMNEVGQELVKAIQSNAAMNEIASIVDKPDINVDNVVRVLVDGEPVFVEVHNKQLLEMLEQVHTAEFDKVTEVVRKINGGVKQLITSKNPLFAISNTMRDYQTYMVNSTEANVFKRWNNIGKAVKQVAKDIKGELNENDTMFIYKAMGVGGSGIMAKDNARTVANITGKKAVVNKNTGAIEGYKEFGPLHKGWNKFNELLEVVTGSTETTFRLAEFIGAMERGATPEEATLKAMEVTVDFNRSGDYTRQVDAYVKYLNAGVQALDRLGRQLKKHPIQTINRSAMHIVLPALLLAGINGGDEEYEMLSDRVKDNNFLIPLYLFGGEEGKYLKLPKSREYGIVAMLAERLVYGRGFDNFGTSIMENIAPANPITDNIIFDIARAYDDEAKDFAGRYIVPASMQDLDAKEQYDEDTTVLAKKLGQMLNFSPKKIDYYLDGYTGIIGDLLMPLLTPSTYANKDDVASKLLAPVTNKFVSDNAYSSGVSSTYYDNLDTVTKLINSEQSGMSTAEKRAYTSPTEEIKNYVNEEYGNDIDDLTAMLKDDSLSNKEKRELRRLRNKAYKKANELYSLLLPPKNS